VSCLDISRDEHRIWADIAIRSSGAANKQLPERNDHAAKRVTSDPMVTGSPHAQRLDAEVPSVPLDRGINTGNPKDDRSDLHFIEQTHRRRPFNDIRRNLAQIRWGCQATSRIAPNFGPSASALTIRRAEQGARFGPAGYPATAVPAANVTTARYCRKFSITTASNTADYQ
jgi:hypothetical protein